MTKLNEAAADAPADQGPDAFERILAADSRPVPRFIAETSARALNDAPLATTRYTCSDFFRSEVEKMWPHVWQFAAREEELPQPGDYIVYENVGRSFLIVRQDDGGVRAFHNVCLHRGRKLREHDGAAKRFQCPFHGFTWKTDGALDTIPCAWDFPHLDSTAMSLPEATVARWGGYIFLRESADGPSIEEYLAPIPEHFERWRHQDRITIAWVSKVLQANWKVAIEAFLESLHVAATHPQALFFTADTQSRYDLYGDHVSRTITPTGVRHPSIDPAAMDDQSFLDKFLSGAARPGSLNEKVALPEGSNARALVAQMNRRRLAETWGINLDHAADLEMMDAIYYHVFPNFSPWGGFTPTLSYRFRPWPDQDRTLMEVRILSFPAASASPPPRPQMRMLGDDEPWSAAADQLGKLGGVLDQDSSNLKYVQQGLKASKNRRVELAAYQESRIRQLHDTLDTYLAG